MLSTWLKQALAHSNIGQAELARRLTEHLGRSIDRAAVNKMVKGTRGIAGDELLAISELTGFPAPVENPNVVPVVGYVGAGFEAHFYADGHGLDEEAPAPPDRTPRTVAVIVRGDSQLGIADEGYLLYYDDRRDPPTDDMFGELCVVGLADGRVLVKYLYRGRAPGHYDLHSRNAPPLLDQRVLWAAKVKWIKPR